MLQLLNVDLVQAWLICPSSGSCGLPPGLLHSCVNSRTIHSILTSHNRGHKACNRSRARRALDRNKAEQKQSSEINHYKITFESNGLSSIAHSPICYVRLTNTTGVEMVRNCRASTHPLHAGTLGGTVEHALSTLHVWVFKVARAWRVRVPVVTRRVLTWLNLLQVSTRLAACHSLTQNLPWPNSIAALASFPV